MNQYGTYLTALCQETVSYFFEWSASKVVIEIKNLQSDSSNLMCS
jgi:hypothetical protein